MRRLQLAVLLQLAGFVLLAVNALAYDYKTGTKLRECEKLPNEGRTDCLLKLAPAMRKHLEHGDAFADEQLKYTNVLMELGDRIKPPMDQQMLESKLAAYQGAEEVSRSVVVVHDNWAPRYRALIEYFTRLGPEYQNDVKLYRKSLATELDVQAMQRGENTDSEWMTAVLAAVAAYQSKGQTPVQAMPAPQLSAAPATGGAGSNANASSQAASQYVAGASQCVHDEYTSGQLWFVNGCNATLHVMWTSDSGNSWGATDIGPNTRQMESAIGVGYTPKDGRVYLFACAQGAVPVMPDGSEIWSHNYKGQFKCHK